MSKYSTGLRNVGSYQVAGHPYVTGSAVVSSNQSQPPFSIANGEHKIPFPYVTQAVTIINKVTSNTANPLRVHFRETSAGNVISGKHFVEVAHGQALTLDCKCKEIFLSIASGTSNYSIIADLTNIATGSMYELTGSGITE